MTPADKWFHEYRAGRATEPRSPLVWICVPLSVVGLTGLMWSLPVPAAFRGTGALNWGTVFLMASVVYYFIVSISLAFGALPFIVAVAVSLLWLEQLSMPLWLLSGLLLALALLALSIGAASRDGRLRPLHDLLYLMIGPLWLLAAIYRRLGIPY